MPSRCLLLLLACGTACVRADECLSSRPDGLCEVKLSTHAFAPPNMDFPANTRGVFWIDAGDDAGGHSNPFVDLNCLQPFPPSSSKHGKWWVRDATPEYQSWVDVPASYSYVHMLKSLGTRSEVDPQTLTVTWSACGLTCGTRFETFLPLPLSSPSELVGPNEYVRKAVVAGVTVATWKGYRILDESGARTEFFDRLVARVNDTALVLPSQQAGGCLAK
jgi:hypothetical protein